MRTGYRIGLLAVMLGGAVLVRAQMASTAMPEKKIVPTATATAPTVKPTPIPALPADSVLDLLRLQRQVLRQAVTIQSLLAQIKETDLYKQYDDASQKQALTQRALTDRTTAILSSLSLDPAKYEIDLDTFAVREKAATPKK